MSLLKQIWEFRVDIDQEYQGWILIFTTLTCVWLFCLPCYCAGMHSRRARACASWMSQRLPFFYFGMLFFNGGLMFLVIQWLPDWSFGQYLGVLTKSAGWLVGHVLKWATSLVMIVAFCFVVAFKERIALMLGLDHKQIFNCKARDCMSCFTANRFKAIELLIWKVEDLPSADLFAANNVFVEVYLGYNETTRTRVHNNAGSDCIFKESVQLNFDEDDDEEKLFIFVHNQKVVGSAELARVEIGNAKIKQWLEGGPKNGLIEWKDKSFSEPLALIPRGQIWLSAVPVDEEHHGYAELATC